MAADLVGSFEAHLQLNVMLAFFIPGIVYLADAVGTQTETVVVRGLSLGVPMRRMVAGELLAGILIGVALAAVALPFVWWRWNDGGLALSVGVSVFAACSTATLAAMMLPWLFDAFGSIRRSGAVLSRPSFKISCPSGSTCRSRLLSCHDDRAVALGLQLLTSQQSPVTTFTCILCLPTHHANGRTCRPRHQNTRRMMTMSATRYVVPQIGKIRSANHFGRKISATEPRTAPSRSARSVSGQVHPDATSTTPSRTTKPTATHVHGVMRSITPLNSA